MQIQHSVSHFKSNGCSLFWQGQPYEWFQSKTPFVRYLKMTAQVQWKENVHTTVDKITWTHSNVVFHWHFWQFPNFQFFQSQAPFSISEDCQSRLSIYRPCLVASVCEKFSTSKSVFASCVSTYLSRVLDYELSLVESLSMLFLTKLIYILLINLFSPTIKNPLPNILQYLLTNLIQHRGNTGVS